MENTLHIYHGSNEIILKPAYGKGRKNNDYGQGFYCTEYEELAKEWACSPFDDGFANHYTLDMSHLRVLDLSSEEYSILNWMAVLMEHRLFTLGAPVTGEAKEYLAENFGVDTGDYDVIIGCRADDAYYDLAQAFLNNAITVDQFSKAMKLGGPAEQLVLKSKSAFDSIRFIDFSTADHQRHYTSRKARSENAERNYRRICEESSDGLYMADIIREGVQNDDPRIPWSVRK